MIRVAKYAHVEESDAQTRHKYARNAKLNVNTFKRNENIGFSCRLRSIQKGSAFALTVKV